MNYILNINYTNCQLLNSEGTSSFITADILPIISPEPTVTYNLWQFIIINKLHSNLT